METPYAIANAAIARKPILAPRYPLVAYVIAFAKRDLPGGTSIPIGIGGDCLYGKIDRWDKCRSVGAVPICLFDREGGDVARVKRHIANGEPITWDAVELPETDLLTAYRQQERWLLDQAGLPNGGSRDGAGR